jgi:hypothetical protein
MSQGKLVKIAHHIAINTSKGYQLAWGFITPTFEAISFKSLFSQ